MYVVRDDDLQAILHWRARSGNEGLARRIHSDEGLVDVGPPPWYLAAKLLQTVPDDLYTEHLEGCFTNALMLRTVPRGSEDSAHEHAFGLRRKVGDRKNFSVHMLKANSARRAEELA